jgi:ADP-ribose pyrophosphatase YjhB (NUDIX family)
LTAEPHSPRPATGVAGVVFDDQGRVLLIRRGRPPAQGLWSVPGGKQRVGETLAETCRREIAEETGLVVTVGPVIAVVERRIEGFHYVIIDFLASPASPGNYRVQAADDATEACWVALQELDRYPLVEGLRRVIAAADRIRREPDGGGLRDLDGSGGDFVAG